MSVCRCFEPIENLEEIVKITYTYPIKNCGNCSNWNWDKQQCRKRKEVLGDVERHDSNSPFTN